ncbi:diguanylate cyclase [Comamonas testosteroni]|uniref:Putative 4-hydroxy-4-methyl-2-oxoglutarate aldolase n=1 Tax=Comamonas testosteroni TaxID=285 RepID=A0A5A7MJV5_COMTE|nr:RraA family protein [Comamonas testosteroni]GEQ78118.1 diguanylate cyclase [Comamonas testosteroni]
MSQQQAGWRIRTDFQRIPESLVSVARDIPVAVIGDVSHRLFSFPGGFQNYSRKALTFAGPAFTVKVRPGDNLFLHKALDIAQPGDVIVVDAAGALENAILGEMMGRYGASRGIAGIVIDGAVRDRAGLEELPIPVYARGVTPNGPWKSGPGQIGHPIAAGGIAISSGDLVIGDQDGVIVLPRADAQVIIEHAQAHVKTEEKWAQQIAERAWPRSWVDEAIAAAG